MNNPTTYQKIISSTPPDFDAILLGMLSTGKKHAIGRRKILDQLNRRGCSTNERVVRQTIHDLRRDGHLICSAPGEDGGYYIAATHEEFVEFCNRELHPKAMDMLETERAMKASARRVWGDAVQAPLF